MSHHRAASSFSRWLSAIAATSFLLLAGCGTTQIERGDVSAFAAKDYQTYAWNHAAINVRPGDQSPLAIIGPVFREETNARLQSLGYREVAIGGDFVVSLQFKTSIEQGALPKNSPSSGQVPRAVINRSPDPASVDNAQAMAGPREMNNVLLKFDDGTDGGLLWAAAMSRLVEDVNRNTIDADEVRRNARNAIRRATSLLPRAGQ